jgi:3-dehydroquinate synthetase
MSDLSNRSIVTIRAKSHAYSVVIGQGLIKELLDGDQPLIVADRRFQGMLESQGRFGCIYIDAVESSKTLSTVEDVIISLQKLGARSNSKVLAIGGGIIQDIMTLVASLYMRGIAWIYVPTTLLAMADSCVGGKSSINTKTVKNLIGNIFPPETIYAKKWFVEIDEFDNSERKQLNFGHTFGHALEVGSSYGIPHGLAVASGVKAAMIYESKSRDLSKVEEQFMLFADSLVNGPKFKWTSDDIDWESYASALNADKKHSAAEYVLLLPNAGGGVRVQRIEKSAEVLSAMIDAQKQSLGRR